MKRFHAAASLQLKLAANDKLKNMNKDNKNTELDNTGKKLHISDVIKRSLIEEWKGIRILGCGRYKINREESAKMQKRYLELNRILLSEYN